MPRNKQIHLAGCLLLEQDNTIWLLHRSGGPVQWELPGGKVENGESAYAAAAREVHEELGISVQSMSPYGQASFVQSGRSWRYKWFVCRDWNGTPTLVETQAFDDLRTFSLSVFSDPPDDFSPNLRALGRELHNRKGQATA